MSNAPGNYDKNVNYSNKLSEGIDLCVHIRDKNFTQQFLTVQNPLTGHLTIFIYTT